MTDTSTSAPPPRGPPVAGKTAGAKNRSSTPGPRTSQRQPLQQSQQGIAPGTAPGNLKEQPAKKDLGALDEKTLRAGFLKKVYGILTVQLLVTLVVSAAVVFTPSIRDICVGIARSDTTWFRLALLLPTLGSLLVLNFGGKRHYPTNYICLAIFTLAISVKLGYICAVFFAAGHGQIIMQAAVATVVIFMGLTAYALLWGKEFSFLGGFLSVALWGLLLTGIVGVFFPQALPSLAIGFLGALTFCGYILYDTWRLHKVLSYDDYMVATIEIYLDVVNLFLYILQILIELQNDSKKKSKSRN